MKGGDSPLLTASGGRGAAGDKRLRAFLSDQSNIPSPEPLTKRSCATKAGNEIVNYSQRQAPRGVHTAKIKRRKHVVASCESSRTSDRGHPPHVPENNFDHTSLYKLLKSRPEVLTQGMECIHQYIERNSTFVMQKAIALHILAVCLSNGGGVLDACAQASDFTQFSAEAIRRWAVEIYRDYFGTISSMENITDSSLEHELSSNRGRHPKCASMMHDENFRLEIQQYVRENGYVKGKPNLTLQQFMTWVNDKWGVGISTSTASLWLHELGFSYQQFSKGVYFDGHERPDVLEDRKVYLETLLSYENRMMVYQSPATDPSSPIRPIIRVFHDESTFHSNADQTFHWCDGTKQALKQKSLGQAIMVSDFIDEVGGFLEYEGEAARLLLEHQSEGYFTNQMLIAQVHRTISIFEKKYPAAQGLFIFDNAPSHTKRPDDALNADKMNVKDGGKQPFMRDASWEGVVQNMTLPDGRQKGMKTVLEERGVDTKGMNAEKLREELHKFEVITL